MEEKEIGELFREKLSDFHGDIPAEGWKNLQKDPAVKKITRPYRVKRTLWVSIGTLAVISFVTLLFIMRTPKQTTTHNVVSPANQVVTIPEISTKGLAEDNNEIRSTQGVTPKTKITPAVTPSTPLAELIKEMMPILPAEKVESVAGNEIPYSVPIESVVDNKIAEVANNGNFVPQNSHNGHHNSQKTDGIEGELRYSNDTSVCKKSPVTLFVENALDVRWSTGMQGSTQTIIPEEPLLIYAQVQKLDKSDTVIYFQIDVFDCDLFIPSAFTPNGDGLNDEFLVYAPMEITQYECVIFDKASRVLFQTKSIQQGWDGMFEGRPLPSGGYFYVIKFRDKLNEQHIQKGQLVLVR